MNPIDTIAKNLSDGLYFLAFILDKIVYSFIPKLYKLIIYLANVDLFNGNPAVKALMNRVYILVGVFMLFKLAFSIVKYIVDPNAFSDQSRGFTNLVKRLLIALILLVSIPWLFEKVYEVQGKILSSNIIPNLILGTSDSEQSDIEETAKDVQFLIFGPFYTINPVGSLSVCDPSPDYPLSNIIGTTDMALISGGDCLTNLADLMDESDDVGATDVTIENFFGEKRDFSSLGALISVYEDNQRVVNYTPVVSTLCGGYLVFLLLSFCIDVGARAIKLLFLQILSPVAVISSVDPASSSQSDKLKEWGKECLSTFASLFLRLAVIYLVIQLVKVITAKLFAGAELYNEAFRSSADTSLNIFVYIFLILGAFQVAKKIPDLIEKAFGIKMSGDLQLNPFKALSENAGVGLGLAGVGIGATAVASGAVNTLTGIVEGKGVIGTARSAVGGFFGGGYRSLRGAMNGEKGMKNFSNAFGSAMFARQQRDDLNRQGSTWQGRFMADVNRHLGLMNAAQRQELEYSRDEAALSTAKKETAREKERVSRNFKDYSDAVSAIDQMINNRKEVTDAEKMYEEAKATGDYAQIAAAQQLVDDAKRQEFRKMLTDTTDQNHQRLMAYQAETERIRSENQTIASYDNPIDSVNATFSKTSMYAAQDELSRIEYAYSTGIERIQSDMESDLEARKSSAAWKANELDNSSRAVKSPQPEGWKPSGEISGSYGPQFGPGVWGRNGGGNNGRGRS